MATEVTLSFYPLVFVLDTPDVIVGRKDIDSYAAFPEDAAELLKQLQAGLSPEEAARWYWDRYRESVDIADFLATLHDLQFVCEPGDAQVFQAQAASAPAWQWLGRAVFSPLAWIIYVAVFGYALWLMLRLPYLRPNYSNFFFTQYLVIMELGLFFGQVPGILFHELFHVLAGRRLGVSSRLGMGHRLYFIVFETYLDGLWSVPRRARYLPYLAGMLGDLLWFSLLTIVAGLTYPSLFPSAFCLALALATLLRFIWQFYFYLQTDIYYVFNTVFRCIDLQQTTRQYLENRIRRLLGRTNKLHDEEVWHECDRQVVRWYALFFAAGYLFTLGSLILFGLPAAWRIFSGVVIHLVTHETTNAGFWDACIFLFLNALQLAALVIILLRELWERRRKKRTAALERKEIA